MGEITEKELLDYIKELMIQEAERKRLFVRGTDDYNLVTDEMQIIMKENYNEQIRRSSDSV